MKVLHLTTQISGGAGRAAFRLHEALLRNNTDSTILVQSMHDSKPNVYQTNTKKSSKITTPFRIALDQIPCLLYKKREKDIFSSTFFPSNKTLLKRIQEINPDIIHLHWINSGFINIFDLAKMNKPILWSLHDANTYTGGCHVVKTNCDKYKTFCHTCPFLESKTKYDLSYFNFHRKSKAYKQLNLTINGLSRWIASEAKSSSLLCNLPIVNLPNTINTAVFRPINKHTSRNILGLGDDKLLIGFGAISGTEVKRKGYFQLKKSLEMLPNKHLYRLIVFGSTQGEHIAGIDTLFLGHIYDDTTLALLYSSLDLFITPSLAENLSNAIMESLSCGTPVVAFDIGGNSDLISHKYNGFLALNIDEICNGILWCLDNLEIISENARSSIVNKFDYNIVSKLYQETYSILLKNIKSLNSNPS